ncbi:MAG: amidohydrolase [Porphyromonadaceae bacterium]|nr:MAG: amidohydrolase [Porphyromonadaceae bacterium]
MKPDTIKSLATQLSDEIITIRRTIHANPELSFQEFETAGFIERILDGWGISHERIANTGITGVIEGSESGKYLVLRADIDALPIVETNTCDYRSKNAGVMHACGHDVHTASLLGAIKIISSLRNDWNGRIRFIFQPAEEVLPGGAQKILESGLLDHPEPDFIIAQHVYPELPAGMFGFREGPYMASTDEIYLDVKGIGGHSALPHKLIDPVLIASHLVVSLQQIVSRSIPADIPAVLSFGKFDAPGSTNVIPPTVKLEGTFRIMDEQWRQIALDEIQKMASGIVSSMGATLDCRLVPGYPSLKNDPELTRVLKNLAVSYAGPDQIATLPLRMTGEDFSRYAQRFPAVFYRLGTGGGNFNNPVHHPEFDINESALTHGMGMMAWLAMQACSCPEVPPPAPSL